MHFSILHTVGQIISPFSVLLINVQRRQGRKKKNGEAVSFQFKW